MKDKGVYKGALRLAVKSHSRKYKNADTAQDTPIYSAQSPFDEKRYRLKGIIPSNFAKLFTDRIYFMWCENVPVFVDIWSGQRVLEVIPQVDPLADISSNFYEIEESEFADLWLDAEIIGFEKRIMPTERGNSVEWTLFYTDTDMTHGLGQASEQHSVFPSQNTMVYAKF